MRWSVLYDNTIGRNRIESLFAPFGISLETAAAVERTASWLGAGSVSASGGTLIDSMVRAQSKIVFD